MKWLDYLMGFAKHARLKSKDPTTQVGAAAVGQDNEILETGFNGLPRGVEDRPERMERPAKYLWTGHAEENLITTAARRRLAGSTVFVTHLCCCRCARMMINAGVTHIIYADGTTSMPQEEFDVAMQMLEEAGVTLTQYKDPQ